MIFGLNFRIKFNFNFDCHKESNADKNLKNKIKVLWNTESNDKIIKEEKVENIESLKKYLN